MATPRELKVGVFVAMGLLMAGVVVFLIGDERQLFKKKASYYTTFNDIEGLKQGAPVRMGGYDIGTVANVAYTDDLTDPKIRVTLSIVGSESLRIREGSQVRIENKGLLGDKMVTISLGDPERPAIASGSVLPSTTQGGVGEIVGEAREMMRGAKGTLGNLERSTKVFTEEEFQRDVRETARALAAILRQLETGQGYAGKLLNDEEEAGRLSRSMQSVEQTSDQLRRTITRVDAILSRVEKGPGFAHELIYGEEGTQTLAQFGSAAGEVALTLRGVREGNGLAHGLLYGGEGPSAQVMEDLAAMSADLRAIVAGVRAGRGTVGALLVDPSVYEDLKVLLGNVERNKTLRAIVRYSIRQGEQRPAVEVRDPAAPEGQK